jgi:hypothetical protein
LSAADRVFLDAAYAIALSCPTDQFHAAAIAKEWGLTDCLSFVVMNERGVTQALTTDEHFQQAGFKVLLRNPTP